MTKEVRVPVQVAPDQSYAITDRIKTADLGCTTASKISVEWHFNPNGESYAVVSATEPDDA